MNTITDLNNVQELTEATTPATYQVATVAPVKVPDNHIVIDWSRRGTEIPAENRYRSITIPESALFVSDSATESRFVELLRATIYDLAKERFKSDMSIDKELDTLKKDVPAAHYTVDAILAFWAEDRESKQIKPEQIVEWLKASATLASFTDTKQKAWLEKVPKIAHKTYTNSIKEKDALAIAAQILPDDIDNPIAEFVLLRCQKIINTQSQESAL